MTGPIVNSHEMLLLTEREEFERKTEAERLSDALIQEFSNFRIIWNTC